MSPRRRFAVIAAVVLASLGGSTVAANAVVDDVPSTRSNHENRYDDWWCVYAEELDTAVCGGNPLPPRLPLPENRPRL